MRASTTTTTVEQPSLSNRRQPARQARTNPPRNAASASRPFGGRGSIIGQQDDRATTNASPGFFPAITHFTDSISALPREMIRHETMLKEVDAKMCGPEETLKQLMNAALRTPMTSRKAPAEAPSSGITPSGGLSQSDANIQIGLPNPSDAADMARRRLFLQLRIVMGEMLMTLDEKNNVMSTATDALDKQLKRCESSYPYINLEISEETRLGSLRHWAYQDKTTEKKGTTASERTRRDAAAANGTSTSAALSLEAELAASRSEARREAMAAARKQRAQHVDSDFDDSRIAKKPPVQARNKRAADPTPVSNGSGLGITNGQSTSAANAPKRRKIEKPLPANITSAMPMERSLSAVFGTNGGGLKGGRSSPRVTPGAETSKKRGRGGTVTNGTGRRRAGTNASTANSPLMASSPVVGTFAAASKAGNIPAIGTMQRSASTRGRQNSSQTNPPEPTRVQNTSTNSSKNTNSNGVAIPQLDGGSTPKVTKDAPAKPVLQKPDSTVLTEQDRNTSRSHDRTSLKREAPSPPARSRAERPPSISTSRTNGKASKTATPVSSSFPEPTRPRSGRNTEPAAKRSHKKGAGILAQQQLLAAQAAAEEEGSLQGEGEEEEEGEADGEPRYCYCNGVSHGQMIACDYEGCEIEWFHLECAGLMRAPSEKTKWYCDACKKKLKA